MQACATASTGWRRTRRLTSLDPLPTEETSRIWSLFPTANYRTSIAYLATPVWIDLKQPESIAPPVVEDRLDVGVRATLPERKDG